MCAMSFKFKFIALMLFSKNDDDDDDDDKIKRRRGGEKKGKRKGKTANTEKKHSSQCKFVLRSCRDLLCFG